MMKRAVTAALVGGLMIFAVPTAAFAHEDSDRKAGDCSAQTEQAAGPGADCASQPEGAGDSDAHQAPDQHGRRENHDGDDGTILF
jgi:hypothetical protein